MSKAAVLVHDCGNPIATTERFRVSMAQTLEDVTECQRLRYLVFNCELGEGLDSSARTGLDRDQFDFICDHLIGCSSLSSQDANERMALYEALRERYLVEESLRPVPAEGHHCESNSSKTPVPSPPRLFRAYLEISARVCGPAAIDREFKTIDHLTLIDLQRLPERVRMRFF